MTDVDQKRSTADLDGVVAFHRRRLAEMALHQASLDAVVFPNASRSDRADRNLLAKPLAYQTLVTLWAASPYSVGSQSWVGWECESVYSLANDFAADGFAGRRALMQYIDRVVDAAQRHGLVTRETSTSFNRKISLRATELLHSLMLHQALSATDGGGQNG